MRANVEKDKLYPTWGDLFDCTQISFTVVADGTNWSGYLDRRYTEHALTDTPDVSIPSYTLELKITRDHKTEQWVRGEILGIRLLFISLLLVFFRKASQIGGRDSFLFFIC